MSWRGISAVAIATAVAALVAASADGVTGSDTIKTIAGMGRYHARTADELPGYAGDGGPATKARFNNDWGVAVDARGNVYVADRDNQRIRKIDRAGTITTYAGNGKAGFSGDGGPATAAELDEPSGVAVDAKGDLYILDQFNYRIRKVSTAGIITTFAGNGTVPNLAAGDSGDGGPATAAPVSAGGGVAVDRSGNVYVGAPFTIRKIDKQGIITTFAGTPHARGFGGDGGPAARAHFNDAQGGLAFDTKGDLYVGDTGNQRVRKIDTRGIITTVAGNGRGGFSGDGRAATRAQLYDPHDVAVDRAGNVYITDTGNSRLRRIDSRGAITTVAGSGKPGEEGYGGDGGRADRAQVTAGFVAIGPQGDVYFSDNGNQRVRVVLNARPHGSFTATPSTGPAPLRVTFDATASRDRDGSVAGYRWNFGDGTTGLGRRITHSFARPGVYKVILVVEDDTGGSGATSRTVRVDAASP